VLHCGGVYFGIDADVKVGIAVYCVSCGMRKAPVGRSVAPEQANSLCDWECDGYNKEPFAGSLWPNETEEEFGYAIGAHGWKEIP
jgi:hypothetical protein